MPNENPMHPFRLSTDHALGARARARGDATAPGSHAGSIETTAANRRASLRDAESLDGSNTLLDQNAPEGQNRDELARLGLQPEACNEDPRNPTASRGDQGVDPDPFYCAWGRCSIASPVPRQCVLTQPRPKAEVQRTNFVFRKRTSSDPEIRTGCQLAGHPRPFG